MRSRGLVGDATKQRKEKFFISRLKLKEKKVNKEKNRLKWAVKLRLDNWEIRYGKLGDSIPLSIVSEIKEAISIWYIEKKLNFTGSKERHETFMTLSF